MNLDETWAGLDAGLCTRKQEGAFICSPIGDNRVSRYEQEEEGQILGAAKWFVLCMVFVLAAALSAFLGAS